ncbi:MAG: hypothetical protein AAFQ94_15360 [Bacteroidota bacterium]
MANDFYNNPSKNTVITFVLLYVISMVVMVLVLTDLFTTRLFAGNNAMVIVLMILSTVSLVRLLINYRKSRSDN